jgi:hypothetical protein
VEVRADFNRIYDDYMQRADEMLSSRAVGGYKTIRNKLISHHELRQSKQSPTGYDFFDVKTAKVKYGDERRLVETLQVLTKQLLLIVKSVDFSWQSLLQREENSRRSFGELNTVYSRSHPYDDSCLRCSWQCDRNARARGGFQGVVNALAIETRVPWPSARACQLGVFSGKLLGL